MKWRVEKKGTISSHKSTFLQSRMGKEIGKVALSQIHLNFNQISHHKNLKSATTKKLYELRIKSDSKQQKKERKHLLLCASSFPM